MEKLYLPKYADISVVGGSNGLLVDGGGVLELLGIGVVVPPLPNTPPPTAPNLKSVVPKFRLSTGVDSSWLKITPAKTTTKYK